MIEGIYRRYIWPSVLFAWLRMRIRYNQLSRSSKLAQAFTVLGVCIVVVSIVGTWIAGLLVGIFLPGQIGLENYYLVWNVLVLFALVSWMVHVLNEAQRGDPISLDKILHLPVSPGQAFVVNYLSSLGTTVFLMTAGVFTGLIVGSLFSVGLKAIAFVVPATTFLLAMTSITYLLQGWIANIMANPRKRQTIAVLIPIAIIVVTQVPAQLINLSVQREVKDAKNITMPESPEVVAEPPAITEESSPPALDVDAAKSSAVEPAVPSVPAASSDASHDTKKEQDSGVAADPVRDEVPALSGSVSTDTPEMGDTKESREKRAEERRRQRMESLGRWKSYVSLANVLFPPFWLAGSVEMFVQGSVFRWQPWALSLVMGIVGIQSLRWSHRSTLRYWRGELNLGSARPSKRAISSAVERTDTRKRRMVERRLPWVSEETSAVATMTWASMMRAPEIKMFMLLPTLIPFILFLVVRSRMLPGSDVVRAMMICAFSTFVLLIASGVTGNMFAYDRGGFRLFVLSPLSRERILFGRNLAHLPLIGTLTILCAAIFGLLYGVSFVHWVTMVLVVSATLPPYFLVMNLMSIYTPFPMAAGSIQPKHFDFVTVLLNLLLSTILPVILAFCMLPLALQAFLDWWIPGKISFPIGLPLALLIVLASCGLYRWAIPIQGRLLARREKEVLRVVTSKAE